VRRTVTGAVGFGRSVVAVVQDRQVTFLAAGIAYYAFVSLVPLLLLALVVASVLGGDALAEEVVDAAGQVLTPAGADLIRDALTADAGRGGATVVGVAGLLWGGLKVFRGLDSAFSQVFGTSGEGSLLTELRDGAVVLFAVGAGGAAVAGVAAAVAVLHGPLAGELASLVGLLTLVVVFLPLYYVFPNVPLSLRDALPGAVVAATGWTVLGTAFRVYAANADAYAAYGVLGGVLLLVTWLYVGAILLMLGAVVNAVLTGYADPPDRQVQHPGGRQLRTTRPMIEEDDTAAAGAPSADGPGAGADDEGADDGDDLEAEVERLREELAAFEDDIEDRTVHRDELESDLKRYVRRRVRRGHARGWGPYLVLLYGTAMTIGAFYLLSGGWALLAMLVVWLSTLGLYVLMMLVGAGLSVLGLPGRLRNAIGDWRS